MRAVLYCRVSTAEQVANLSLPTQEKACRQYAEREGYEVAEVFVDRGESAKTTHRPEFQRLLTYCRQKAGRVHAVIVYGLSRFSRNNADHHTIAAVLRGYGVALRSVTEPIDDSPAGRFMEAVIAGMAQFDNDLRADRTKVGMRAALERGRWVWKAPTGYRNGSRQLGEPSIVPDASADAIRSAFADLADGSRTAAEVFQRLRAIGIRGWHAAISPQTFYRLIRNPAYCGRLRSPGFDISRDGDWVPLVDQVTWQRAQLRLEPEVTKPARRPEHPDFPLRRFAYCGVCDRPLTGAWSKGRSARHAYYECRKRCQRVRKSDLEDAFLDYLDRMRPTPDLLVLLRETHRSIWRAEVDRAVAERGQLEAQATRLRSQLRRLDDAFLFEKAIDQVTYTSRRDEARGHLAETELLLSHATIETIDAESILDTVDFALLNGSTLWRSATRPAQRVKLQWLLCPSGVTWTGQKVSNRGSGFAFYEIGAVGGPDSRVASPMRGSSNRWEAWAAGWRAYLDAA